VNTEYSDLARRDPESSPPADDTPAPDNGPQPPAPTPAPPEPAAARRRGGFTALLALLFSAAALALAAWMWWQGEASIGEEQSRFIAEISRLESGDEELRLRITELREVIDSLASGDVTAEFRAMQQRMEADREQLARLEQTIRDEQVRSQSLQTAADSMQNRLQAAEAAVTGMSTRELDAGGELDLAEVDYLLRLANERLKLFADPLAADDALQVADLHLAALDNPMYLGIRQEIAAARRQLSALEMPDYLQLAGRLDDLQATIPGLVFKGDEVVAEAPAAEAEASGWWAKTRSVFASLVTVRRATEAEGRLSIEDKDFVRQRIWLQIEVAHLALMRRDEAAFSAALDRVEESLSAWFDEDSASFKSVSDEIGSLREIDVEPEVPDITGPWSTLRLLRSARPGAPPPPSAAPAATGDEAAGPADGEADG